MFHVREAGYEVEKRVNESQLPLKRDLVFAPGFFVGTDWLESQSRVVDYSFYKEVIDIPVRPSWHPGMKSEEARVGVQRNFTWARCRFSRTKIAISRSICRKSTSGTRLAA